MLPNPNLLTFFGCFERKRESWSKLLVLRNNNFALDLTHLTRCCVNILIIRTNQVIANAHENKSLNAFGWQCLWFSQVNLAKFCKHKWCQSVDLFFAINVNRCVSFPAFAASNQWVFVFFTPIHSNWRHFFYTIIFDMKQKMMLISAFSRSCENLFFKCQICISSNYCEFHYKLICHRFEHSF